MLTLFDGHSAVVTPEALEQAGIRGPMTFGSRSTIVCDDAGVPTGRVLEAGALALVDAVLPAAPLAERAAGLGRLLDEMAATGLTGGHVMDLSGDAIDLYRWLDERGRLPMRLRLAPWCAPEDDRDRWAEIVAMQSLAGSLWSVDGVKLFMDGTIDGGTAWLHAPDCHGESTAAYWLDPGDYSAAVRFFAAAGVPTATHAIGDAAVHHVLDTIESDDHRDRGTRHRVEHIETLRDDQVGRFVRLGVVASMQPTHATDYTLADLSDNWSNRLGEERARRGWRSRDIAATGAVLALGSDWPIAPYDPRWVMRSARDRRSVPHPEAAPVRPEQALTAEQALAGFTTAPAYAASHESVAGRVRVGYRADLSVFTQDPVRTGPADLPDLPVVLTVVDGRVRHRSPEV